LDRLAQKGTRFTNAYSSSPICVPARASLATGRHVHQIGCWDNALAYAGQPQSWAHRLQENGCPVVSIGKLHYRSETDPTGFDEQILPMHLADGVGDLMGCLRPDVPVRYQCKNYATRIGPGETPYNQYDQDIADKACQWLKDRAANASDRPWVLFVSFIAPHFPLIVPQKYFDLYPLDQIPMPKPADVKYQQDHPWWRAFNNSYIFDRYFENDLQRKTAIASYYGLCSFSDENIGRVLDTLEAVGLSDETRVIYLSDHGDNLGARGIWGKSTMHEESVGIPLIVSGPGVPEDSVVSTPVSLVDVFPTMLDSSGILPHKDDADLPGSSLLKIASANDDLDRTVFSEYHAAASISAVYMLRRGRYKYVHYTDYEAELFDLVDDPEEMINLAQDKAYVSVLNDFKYRLERMLDPREVDRQAKEAQARRVAAFGGREKVLRRGGLNGTPVPGGTTTLVPLEK
jgi:choline-sulfatase